MHHPLPTLILLLTLPLYSLCQNKFSFGGNGPNLEVGSMTTIRFTPNKFVLTMFDSEGKSGVESGLKIRLRFN